MSPGALIAGFDAGQTHTRCRLARLESDHSWTALAEARGSGVSHLDAPGGEQRFQEALRSSLAAALSALEAQGDPSAEGSAERTPPALAAAAIGASGIEAGSPVQPRGQQLAATVLGLPPDQVLVSGDERTALEGACGTGSGGILLISGTGCIGVGRNAAGALHRCGGWGWLVDGAGSACDIGRDGLALSLQMADGRQPATALQQAIWDGLGLRLDDPAAAQTIKALVVEPGFGSAGFARLAPLVHQQALAGDAEARAFVMRSAEVLAAMAATIAARLQLSAPAVWPSGGALEHLGLLRESLGQELAGRCPGAHLARPAGDACDGALRLAQALVNAAA